MAGAGRPALAVCWNDINAIRSVIEPLVPAVFSRVTFGTSVNDFHPELTEDGPLVLAVGGSCSHDVIKIFASQEPSRIQWIHSLNTGVDAYQLPKLSHLINDVPITNARGAFSSLLAEHVILAMLYFNRYVWQLQANKERRLWSRHPNIELRGQVLGIVGYGDIAKMCAQRAMAMGMSVVAFKRGVDKEVIDELGVQCFGGDAGLAHVLSGSDFVLAVLPATPQTFNFFSAERLSQLKNSAVFINIGRGSTVDEAALVNALQSDRLRGAALDVTSIEPLPQDHPLWAVDQSKLLLSPHNADVTDDVFVDAAAAFVKAARRFSEDGALPEYRISIEKGY